MKRNKYAILFCVSNLLSLFAFLWLFAGKISTGVAEHLPAKNASSYTVALAIVLAGGWRQIARPHGNPSHGLSLGTVTIMLRVSKLTMLVVLSRFVVPLMSNRLGMFSSKPNALATAWYFGICYVASTVAGLAPLFLKHALPSAEEVMLNDARRPVLYFRSFEKESQRAPPFLRWTRVVQGFHQSQGGYYLDAGRAGDALFSDRSRRARAVDSSRTSLDEQMVFALAFERIGPYIALGRPNEGYRDMDLGAAKKYVSNDQWQDVVCQWLEECAAVVLDAGDSAALGWEIDQVVLLVPPQQVIVMCPYSDDEYESFMQAHSRRFPRSLPRTRPTSRLLVFDSAWHARELANVNNNASETLAPFFAQVGTRIQPHRLRVVPRDGKLDGIREV